MKLAILLAAISALSIVTQASAADPAPQPGWRTVAPDDMLVIDTNKGRIIVELTPVVAPNHVAQVRALAKQHFYDGQHFFRVIDDFMDQTGDPTNTGAGGSKLPDLKAEFTFRRDPSTPLGAAHPDKGGAVTGFLGPMVIVSPSDALAALTADGKVAARALFCTGVAGGARNSDPDSANSQFFLMRGRSEALDGQYTAFGRVLVGQPVVAEIKTGEPVEEPQDVMTSVRLGSDLAPAQRPTVTVMDTASPAFAEFVAKARAAGGASFSLCDVAIPAKVQGG